MELDVVSAFTFNNKHHHRHHHHRHHTVQRRLQQPIVLPRSRRRDEQHAQHQFTTQLRVISKNDRDNDDDEIDNNEVDYHVTNDTSSPLLDSLLFDTFQSQPMPPPTPRVLPAVKPYRPLGPKLTKSMRQLDDSLFRNIVQYLAELSLQDYQWRTSLFQQNEADRMMEESMARIRFGEDEIQTNMNYIRPMDAPTLGPLGKLEKYYVTLLYDVFHEEQRRAQRIIAASGTLIRPSKNTIPIEEDSNDGLEDVKPLGSSISTSSTLNNDTTSLSLGPLGRFEARVVAFWTSIQREEMLRIRTKTWRPKDLQERGPIGQLEYFISTVIEDIRSSELIRAQQAKIRNDGTIVRPIDIPGPLGEIELQVSDIIQEEFRRVREKRNIKTRTDTTVAPAYTTSNSNDSNAKGDTISIPTFTVLRPKDATNPGPLGAAEASAYAAIQSVSQEEMERLKAIQRTLIEYRPINTHQDYSNKVSTKNQFSILYTLETFVMGIFRAPQLVWSVMTRVQELLSSTPLDTNDLQILQQQQQQQQLSSAANTVSPPPPSFSSSSSTPPMNDVNDDNNKNNKNQQEHTPPPPQGEFL